MPALTGQVITTLRDGAGTPVITVSWFFNPANGNLRDSTTAWTSPSGKVYPAGSALIADNGTGRAVSLTVVNPETSKQRTFAIPVNDRKLTAAQLLAIPAPNGPVATSADLAGLSFDLS
jgi:hypothetical protein